MAFFVKSSFCEKNWLFLSFFLLSSLALSCAGITYPAKKKEDRKIASDFEKGEEAIWQEQHSRGPYRRRTFPTSPR